MNELKRQVKRDVLFSDFQKVSAKLIVVYGYFCWFCHNRNLPCVVTSILDDVPGRVSATHTEGRAFDASIKGWTDQDISDLIDEMRKWAWKLGAYSKSDGLRRVVICHSGTAKHLHFQVSRGA